MEVIISHVNIDFDGLASMVAAKKLHPKAQMVIQANQNHDVKPFMAIYRDALDMIPDHEVKWADVGHIILVDVAHLDRIGKFVKDLDRDKVSFTVYDHHPVTRGHIETSAGMVDQVGATVTLLIEEIQRQELPITPFEATIFGLGIYTDTGCLTFSTTTSRDVLAAAILLEAGMDLELVNQYSSQSEDAGQQFLFKQLLINTDEIEMDGLNIVISSHQQQQYEGNVSSMTRRLLDTTGADALIVVVQMKKQVFVIGRAGSKRINLQPLMEQLGGGGHERAAAATLKSTGFSDVLEMVKMNLEKIVRPAITAQSMMNTPVKTITSTTTIEEASQFMYKYGHSGLPVVTQGALVGMISRRDLNKAMKHGLGHAPVNAYMSTTLITIQPDTSFEEIVQTIMKHNIGRLPVVVDDKLEGIITRTDIIDVLHNQERKQWLVRSAEISSKQHVQDKMQQQLPSRIYEWLWRIAEAADDYHTNAFLVGGMVRDLILGKENKDIDVVAEGDGIAFAQYVADHFGGEVKAHDAFGTSTWTHPDGFKVDIASSRVEFYEQPGVLPEVEYAHLKADLSRRDFTINAMAICLNANEFGRIVDYFNGREHLAQQTISILHNLSFVEDPTRILRAIRFEARFGFEMDKQTVELALISIDKLKTVSKARLAHEFQKLFEGRDLLAIFERLFDMQVWPTLVDVPIKQERVMAHAKKMKQEQQNGEWHLNEAQVWYGYLMLPFYGLNHFDKLVIPYAPSRKEMKLAQEVQGISSKEFDHTSYQLGDVHDHFRNMSEAAILVSFSHPDRMAQFQLMKKYVQARRNMPQLLNGEDLKKMGIIPGPIYAQLLSDLDKAWLNEEVCNKKEAIHWVERWDDTCI